MDIDKLNTTILDQRTRSYCVLDGAAVPGLPGKLHEFDPPNFSLLRGELTPDMIHVAPYVALMIANTDFTKWVLQNFEGKNWGIFVQSRFSIFEMRRHFQALMNVHDESGKPLLFRFYDPRVIRKFLPSCDSEQLETFFGKIDLFFAESDNENEILEFSLRDGELNVREIDLSKSE